MNNCQRLSRRVLLTSAALSLGTATAATVVSQAAALQKINQADARYQTTPKGDQRCDGCFNFQPSNACKFVQGNIRSNGWCQVFVAKTKS